MIIWELGGRCPKNKEKTTTITTTNKIRTHISMLEPEEAVKGGGGIAPLRSILLYSKHLNKQPFSC